MAPKHNFSSSLPDERLGKKGRQTKKENSSSWKAEEYVGKMQHKGKNVKNNFDDKDSFSLSIQWSHFLLIF